MREDGFALWSGLPAPFPSTSAIGEGASARGAGDIVEHGRLGFLQYYGLSLCDQVSLMGLLTPYR